MFKIKKLWPLLKYISLGINIKQLCEEQLLFIPRPWLINIQNSPAKRWLLLIDSHSHCHCLMTITNWFSWRLLIESQTCPRYSILKRHNSSRMVVVQCHKQPTLKFKLCHFCRWFYRNKNPELFGSATDFMITSSKIIYSYVATRHWPKDYSYQLDAGIFEQHHKL
jgi:hypothetical protein